MWSNVHKNHALLFCKFKNDSIALINPKAPICTFFRMQFLNVQRWMKWIAPKKSKLFGELLFYIFWQIAKTVSKLIGYENLVHTPIRTDLASSSAS